MPDKDTIRDAAQRGRMAGLTASGAGRPLSKASRKATSDTQAMIESDLAKYKAKSAAVKKRKRKPVRIRSADRAVNKSGKYADDAVRNLEKNLTRVKNSGSSASKKKTK